MSRPRFRRRAPRRLLLVLGMHRSGTSALMGMFVKLGVDPGRTLIGGNQHNPRGFFEPLEVVRAHQRLLRALGVGWSTVGVLPEGWRDTRATAACATTLRRFVERELGGSPLGGVKDPRLCRLVPLWLDLLPELGIEPAVVVAVRDPRQVAASLTARDGLERTHAEQLWLVDMLEAERLTRAVSRTFVGYEQLLADWRGAALRVAGELELAWPRSPERAAPAVDAFLSADLSHQRTATGQLAPRVATAAVLFAEAADGSPLRVHELDRLRDEIRSTSDLLTPLAEAPPRVEQARSGIGNRARGAVRRVRRS